MSNQSRYVKMLKRVLRANAIFSGIFGLVFIFDAGPLEDFMGLNSSLGADASSILIGIGISLLLFSAGLFINTSRNEMNLKEVYATIVLDVAWVAGSAILLFANLVQFTTGGWWFVAILADVVSIFAILQFYFLRKSNIEMQNQMPQLKVQGSEV